MRRFAPSLRAVHPSVPTHRDRGATGLEYGLIIAGTAAVAALTVTTFGEQVADSLRCFTTQFEQAGTADCQGGVITIGSELSTGESQDPAVGTDSTAAPTPSPSPSSSSSPSATPSDSESPTPSPSPSTTPSVTPSDSESPAA